MTAEQRSRIEQRLSEYGPGWNLRRIEEHFTVEVLETPNQYELAFTSRGRSGLRWESRLGKETDFQGGPVILPEGPALSSEQREAVDSVLRSAVTLWLFKTPNGSITKLDMTGGIASLTRGQTLTTRWREDRAVLYPQKAEAPLPTPPFVLAVNLPTTSIEDARWPDLPPDDTPLLPAAGC